MLRIIRIIFVIWVVSLFIALPSFGENFVSLKVLKVVDGDTVFIQDSFDNAKYNIQLQGIQAAKNAKAYLESQILNKTVKAWYCYSDPERDFYELYIDNRSLNLMLVRMGYARMDKDGFRMCLTPKAKYREAETYARSKRLGIWAE